MTTRVSRVEQREQTRQALLEAGATVFLERGFAGASVEAISAAAGYTRGAFYSNFSSREELFAALLQERVYDSYRSIVERQSGAEPEPTARETGEQLARMQAAPEGRWLFRLWLELLAHAGRDDAFKRTAAGFWSLTRRRSSEVIRDRGRSDPQLRATVAIALDIGLALQHFVDPEAVPLSTWADAFEMVDDRAGRDR